jgi:hypothetical protein
MINCLGMAGTMFSVSQPFPEKRFQLSLFITTTIKNEPSFVMGLNYQFSWPASTNFPEEWARLDRP